MGEYMNRLNIFGIMDHKFIVLVILASLVLMTRTTYACTNNPTNGNIVGDVCYTGSTILTGNVFATGNIAINGGVTVTTNNNLIISGGWFANNGVVAAGNYVYNFPSSGAGNGNNGQGFPNSYAGSGGGGSDTGPYPIGGNGGSTFAAGGSGASSGTGGIGQPGATPSAPSITISNIQNIYFLDFPANSDAGQGGSSATNGGGCGCFSDGGSGGGGAYGIFIESQGNFVNSGVIEANGINGQNGGSPTNGGGAGGGGWILIIYPSGGSNTQGTIYETNGIGGSPSGGAGGAGQLSTYAWSGTAPICPPNGCIQPPVTTLSFTPSNSVTFPQSVTITANCANSGDSCDIDYPTAGNHICTGTTSCTYTYATGNVGAGTYSSYWANDITIGQNSVPQTLTVSKGAHILSINNCGNQAWTTAAGWSCTTTLTESSFNNQDPATLYLNGAQVGNTVPYGSNTFSYTSANCVCEQVLKASSPATANYLGNTVYVDWFGYVPLYVENYSTSFNFPPTNGAATTAGNTLSVWHYPLEIYTISPSALISYNTLRAYEQNGLATLQSGVANVFYVPPSNDYPGNYIYQISENLFGNTVTANEVFSPINMFSVNAQPTNGIFTCFQYFPCAVNSITWYSSPTSYKIDTYANVIQGVDIVRGTNTLSLPINLQAIFNQFYKAITFNLTATTGLSTPSLAAIPTNFVVSNAPPSVPNTRELMNISTYDQRNFNRLSANTTVAFTALFNNWTILNVTKYSFNAITSNSFGLYMPSSNYQNPPISFTNITMSSTATNHFLGINNYCPVVENSITFSTYKPYLVDLNGSLYTYNIYSGYGTGGIGQFMQVLSGISSISAQLVQQYKINSNPFAQPLENGGSYQFRFLDQNCHLVYATNFSVWGNPITVSIPLNTTVPIITLPNVTAKCNPVASAMNTFNAVCSGSDTTNKVYLWTLTLYNTTLNGWSAAQSNTVASSAFSYTFNGLAANTVYRVIAVATAPTGQQSFIFDFNTNAVGTGFGVAVRGFLVILFLLVGLGLSSVGENQGMISAQHAVSSTLMIEAFMLALAWLMGLATFIPLSLVSIAIIFLIAIGVMSHRYESGAYG